QMKILLLFLLLIQNPLEVLLDKGYDEYSSGEYIEALHTFKEAMDLDPDNAEIYFLRGLTHFGLENIRESVEGFEKAIELNPDYQDAWQELGYVYLVSQAPDRAVEAYDKAITLSPETAELYVNRGTAKCMMNDIDGAETDWAVAKKLGVDYGEMMKCE
ncbi:HOP2, partial [Symbiodinium microadriaticum]